MFKIVQERKGKNERILKQIKIDNVQPLSKKQVNKKAIHLFEEYNFDKTQLFNKLMMN